MTKLIKNGLMYLLAFRDYLLIALSDFIPLVIAVTPVMIITLGAAIGRKFRLGKKHTQLKQFRFFISYNNFDTVRFRVNIYSIKNGKPGELLNTQEILTELLPQQREWITIDLSPYKIIAKGTIAVAIDWLYHSEKGKYLQLPLTIPAIGATHYYRFVSQDKWKIFMGMSTAIELELLK